MKRIIALILFTAITSGSAFADVGNKDLISIKELTAAGQYQQALEKHIWFHEESKSSKGMGAVRLSHALGAWMDLAKKYPPALDALVKIRDREKELLLSGKGKFQNFQELASINRELKEDQETYELFLILEKKFPEQGEKYYIVAEDLVMKKKNYELYAKYSGDPISKYQGLQDLRDEMMRYGKESVEISTVADQRFTEGVVKLIEFLVAINRIDEAREIQKRALSYFDSEEIRKALH